MQSYIKGTVLVIEEQDLLKHKPYYNENGMVSWENIRRGNSELIYRANIIIKYHPLGWVVVKNRFGDSSNGVPYPKLDPLLYRALIVAYEFKYGTRRLLEELLEISIWRRDSLIF